MKDPAPVSAPSAHAAQATLRLAHSPDPDDAFMWWPLFTLGAASPRLHTGRFRFQPIELDIETLNTLAERGEYEITAMSCAQYPRVRDTYAITACGASMGERYGPKLVAREEIDLETLRAGRPTIAVPGVRTSAFAVLQMMIPRERFDFRVMPFDKIGDAVAAGEFDAGLVIHEGQLTYEASGLHLVADLGRWWHDRHQLPLPLGVNAIRRDLDDRLGSGALRELAGLLRRSVEYALAHREESIDYALRFGRGIERASADRFIEMYVNRWTLDFGEGGRAAVQRFLDEAHACAAAPAPGPVDLVGS